MKMSPSREEFYTEYDTLMPLICAPYHQCLTLGARAVSLEARTIVDIGIGTGNFSQAVYNRFVTAKKSDRLCIHGFDKDEYGFDLVRSKVPGVQLAVGTFDPEMLLRADYHIASLMTHHFPAETRMQSLRSIARSARKGFVNFDVFLSDEVPSIDALVANVRTFASPNFDDTFLQLVEADIRANDHPTLLKEDEALFRSEGMKFEVLFNEAPYAVYHAYRSN